MITTHSSVSRYTIFLITFITTTLYIQAGQKRAAQEILRPSKRVLIMIEKTACTKLK